MGANVTISSRGGTKVLWVHSAHARNNKTAVLLRFIVSDIDIIYIYITSLKYQIQSLNIHDHFAVRVAQANHMNRTDAGRHMICESKRVDGWRERGVKRQLSRAGLVHTDV